MLLKGMYSTHSNMTVYGRSLYIGILSLAEFSFPQTQCISVMQAVSISSEVSVQQYV